MKPHNSLKADVSEETIQTADKQCGTNSSYFGRLPGHTCFYPLESDGREMGKM